MNSRNNRYSQVLSRNYAAVLVCLAWLGPLFAQSLPSPQGWVNDFGNVIPAATERRIEAICEEVKQKTGAEISVVTVTTVGDEHYTDYANKLFEKWGIGEKGKDNGVLLFQAVQERSFRIEVGYGLEGIIPDGLAGEIRDSYVFPYFKKNDFGNGHLNGVMAIASVIAKDAGVQITGSVPVRRQVRGHRRRSGGSGILKILMLALLFLFFRGGGRGRGRRGGILPWLFLGSMMGGGGRSYGGFSSGGGFGGGFGGFGGGMSGGGGAGGSY